MPSPWINLKVLFIVVMVWFSAPLLARDKTDVLVMRNGDRITCEVKRLEGGILEASLDYVDGNIAIDWRKVARLESSAMFLVQLDDGSTYAGTVITPEQLGGTPLKMEIQQIDAPEPILVDQADVVRVTQTSTSRLQRFNGSVTLGSLFSKGNSTTQYNMGSDLTYEETRWSARVRYNSNLSSSSGADTSTRNQLDTSIYRLLRYKNYFYAGSATFLQGSVQSIESQVSVGGGIGAFISNTNRVRFTVLGGLGWQRTHYSSTDTEPQRVQGIGVALVNSNLEMFRFKKTRFTATANLVPALTDPGRVFIRSNLAYYLKLFGKLDWNLSAYGSWDNRPPPELQGSDYGYSLGLSWSFGNH